MGLTYHLSTGAGFRNHPLKKTRYQVWIGPTKWGGFDLTKTWF